MDGNALAREDGCEFFKCDIGAVFTVLLEKVPLSPFLFLCEFVCMCE